MRLELEGRHVLVTGASRGIGLACAAAFLAEGCRVSMVARSIDGLQLAIGQLEAAGRSQGFPADLQDAEVALAAVNAAEATFGPVEVLVNSAGGARRRPVSELTPQLWREAMDAKYFTYLNVLDPVLKRMGERESGAVVNIVGMGGKLANASHLAGGSANAALMLASVGLAAAYARRGVRVNAINPGVVMTERLVSRSDAERRMAAAEGREQPVDQGASTALGRIARPEEIADAAVFLASARASYINGAVLSMDGGTVPMVI